MTKPIKLPPLTVKMLMDVFGSHADIPPALLCTSWKDGIDIDETSMRAQMLVEACARLAVEQATADLRSLASKWESLFNAQVQLTEAARHRADKAGAQRDEARAEVERLREALSNLVALLPDPELDRDEVQRGYVLAAKAALKETK
jgi:Na+/phosphate symporter